MIDIYPQDPPFSIQVELVEGCQLACRFCGIQGIRAHPGKLYKTMSEATLESLFQQIRELKWNARIEFAMHGEPTMHPKYIWMIGTAWRIVPKSQLMLTTNGGGLLKPPGIVENICQLFENGLNILALDDYDGVKIVDKIRPHLPEISARLRIPWYEYPADPAGNPHRRNKYAFITVIADISKSTSGTHARLANHAGSAFPPDFSMNGQRCHRPFRELSVRWDGNVAICCDDWRGIYKCGNVVTDGLKNIWWGPAMEAARRKLYAGERDFGPCYGCTARSYRVGLLPDKKGQDEMPDPDDVSNAILEAAIAGNSYTEKVARPWESK